MWLDTWTQKVAAVLCLLLLVWTAYDVAEKMGIIPKPEPKEKGLWELTHTTPPDCQVSGVYKNGLRCNDSNTT